MLTKNVVCVTTLSIACVILLSGCDSFRSTFGLDHYQADEFNVANHKPLSIPPSYDLMPPNATASPDAMQSRGEVSTTHQAQKALLGRTTEKRDTQSVGSTTITKKASTKQIADKNIREKVANEAKDSSETDNPLADKLAKLGATIKENATRTSNDHVDASETKEIVQTATTA